ncbi:MAG: serine/threonine protein kinase [Myxococcaceae bacterium]|nr:serine/threonine protein kinase [Myxococcaceae bacterium]
MSPPTTTRRYEPLLKIASGGTASVYVGSAAGALGFRQLVAIKRPHAHLADDPTFCAALVEEARIASRLHHANIVDVRDVEVDESGIQLVMDYVEGASLSELIRGWAKEPPARGEAVALRIVLDACEGLRALHELTGDDNAPLGLVHRDVSPANILVGLDGVARIADFGLAKPLLAVERTTSEGALRGKLGYMAPEYIRGKAIDRRIDVFAMGIVLWEVLTRKRLFRGENDGDTLERVQTFTPPLLAELMPPLGAAASALDGVIARALAKDPELRLPTIAALSAELEKVVRAHDLGATHADVREAFAPSLRAHLDDRRRRVQSATAQPPGAPIPSQPPPPASIRPTQGHSGPNDPGSGKAATTQGHSRENDPGSGTAATTQGHSRPNDPGSGSGRRALVAVAALVGVSGIVAAAVLFAGPKETAASGMAAAPHVIASEARPLAGDVRARATGSAPPDEDDATPATPRGNHPKTTRPRARPTSDEPGNKPPRPNPYASSSPR